MLFNENDSENEKMKAFTASRKPLKEMLDSVKNIEGFPIGKDEDILALSDTPWYTACPNPFINDFIEAFGKPYDEDTDTYDRRPFDENITEGKNDKIYMAHWYHTKVPYKAIIPFIEHYTEEGDIVFDGFCGSGMTGVASQQVKRKAILCDLSAGATFISHHYNKPKNIPKLKKEIQSILHEVSSECNWMYETIHSDGATKGVINNTVWSDVLICPYCKNEYVFWDVAIDQKKGEFRDKYKCPHCESIIGKTDCERATFTSFDSSINKNITQTKQVPVLISYSIGNKKYEKVPDDFDFKLIKKIENSSIPYWFPAIPMMNIGEKWGDTWRAGYHFGITHSHHFYTKRNLWVLSTILEKSKLSDAKIIFTSCLINGSKLYRYRTNRKGGNVSGTLYIPSTIQENNVISLFKRKAGDFLFTCESCHPVIITCSSLVELPIKDNSVDYIFTDPPFGSNLMYSELNFILESWLRVFTNNKSEAIINNSQGKSLIEYKDLMNACFCEMYRIIKPNRWITVEFHNSKASVWSAIQDSLTKAGFVIAQVTVLDKKQGSFKQVTAPGSVEKDLVINAYKLKKNIHDNFVKYSGEGLEQKFIQEHLDHLPVEPNIERTEQMLYSKLLAYYIQNGYVIKLNAKQFYDLLKDEFKLIDGYWFIDKQISGYEEWKKKNGLEAIEKIFKDQSLLFINDEKSSLIWLYNFLYIPKTYSDILTTYNQVRTNSDDDIPELKELLDINFIFENGMYRRPLTNKERAKKEERNEKELLKAFDKILLQARSTSKKIKSIRKEAIKLGFAKAYQEKRFEDILVVAGKLSKDILENNSEINDFVEIARMKAGEL